MKYIVDIDALKECIDMLECIKVNGHEYVPLHNVKLFIDRFPKDTFVIPDLMSCGTIELDCLGVQKEPDTHTGDEKGE